MKKFRIYYVIEEQNLDVAFNDFSTLLVEGYLTGDDFNIEEIEE